MVTIKEIREQVINKEFNGKNQYFFCHLSQYQEVSMPDESSIETGIFNFSPYPLDEGTEIYEDESDSFMNTLISFINSKLKEMYPADPDLQLKGLGNGHYFASSFPYRDTISVHFNDESLFIISTWSGQY